MWRLPAAYMASAHSSVLLNHISLLQKKKLHRDTIFLHISVVLSFRLHLCSDLFNHLGCIFFPPNTPPRRTAPPTSSLLQLHLPRSIAFFYFLHLLQFPFPLFTSSASLSGLFVPPSRLIPFRPQTAVDWPRRWAYRMNSDAFLFVANHFRPLTPPLKTFMSYLLFGLFCLSL